MILKNVNSLGGYYPECLYADSSGNIWISFYGTGLDKFDPGTHTFTHYRNNRKDHNSLSNDTVSAILVDHLNNVWAGTNRGLDLLDQKTGTFTHFKKNINDPTSLSHDLVRCLYEDREGDLWIGTGLPWDYDSLGGLNLFDRSRKTFKRYMRDLKDTNSLIDNRVRAVFEDKQGTIWIGTGGNGLHTLNKRTGIISRHLFNPKQPDQLSRGSVKAYDDHITFITGDAAGQIWIGTLYNGITRYDPQTQSLNRYGSTESKNNLLADNTRSRAQASPDGFLWFSTQRASLYKVDIYNTIVERNADASYDDIVAIEEETPTRLLFGTLHGLVSKDIPTGAIRRFHHDPHNSNSISSDTVVTIVKDGEGTIWVGTQKGLNEYNPEKQTFNLYDYAPGRSNKSVLSVVVTADQRIWLGTDGNGLDKLDRSTGKFINYKHNVADTSSISDNVITTILADKSGDLWIGSLNNGGLNKLDKQHQQFRHYLQGSNIRCLFEDVKGKLWVGTTDGLFTYDEQIDDFVSIARNTSENNIAQISSIEADKNNNLWISSETGMYMLNSARDQVVRYGKEKGFAEANNAFMAKSSLLGDDGKLYFGFYGGYFSFSPEKLRSAPSMNRLYLDNIWVNEKLTQPGSTKFLPQLLNQTTNIRLDHDQNTFSINASSIDFRGSADKLIYYKLDDYYKDWRTCNSGDRMYYYKIPPGKYFFHVRTTNTENGEWVEKTMAIIISPPWWKTWWAYTIYAFLLIALVLAAHRYQKSRLLKVEREKTRIKELAQAKEIEKAYNELRNTQAQLIHAEKMASLGELTGRIAHEIQNPLNFVNNFSEVNSELIDEMLQDLNAGKIDAVTAISKDIKENQQKINHHGNRCHCERNAAA